MVEIDDDIVAGDIKARVVQSEGVRYAEKSSFEAACGVTAQVDFVEIFVGDERLIRIDDLRSLAAGNESLRDWIAVVDSLIAVQVPKQSRPSMHGSVPALGMPDFSVSCY